MKKPLSLYVHIPFCEKKCDYCDFTSFDDCASQIDSYVAALCNEIVAYKERCSDHIIKTIYFGGGTPSSIHQKYIGKIFDIIRATFAVDANAEVTIECNPTSVTATKLKAYKNFGINRISLGLQSCDDVVLKSLGRAGAASLGLRALNMIKRSGFENLSVDFICNVPIPKDFSGMGLRRNIESELNFILTRFPQIKHVSSYTLIPEPGTPLQKRLDFEELYELDEDTYIDEEIDLFFTLKEQGFRRYEISNWARPGYECQHNETYWRGDAEYLGIGLAAHSLLAGERFENTPDMGMYLLNPNKVIFKHTRTREDIINEVILLSIRTRYGVNLGTLRKLGVDLLHEKRREVMDLVERKLIKVTKTSIKATTDGMFILNVVINMLTFDTKEVIQG